MKSINNIMINHAIKIADEVKADALLVALNLIQDLASLLEGIKESRGVIIVAPEEEELPPELQKYALKLDIPDVNMTRVGTIKIAIAKGIALGYFKKGSKIVCLSGLPKFGYTDSIFVIEVGKEFEILTSESMPDIIESVRPEVFNAVLNIACEIAAQGRESKKVGTIFVLGDEEKVLQLSRQMIINPFLGYSEEQRNILNADLQETIKEFSAIDGAFIIKENGAIITAGRHLNAALDSRDFPAGLGSRHIAAAGITNVTKAVAIVISQSSGDVSIFKNGKLFISIEKPVE